MSKHCLNLFVVLLLLPGLSLSKIYRKPSSETAPAAKAIQSTESAIKNLEGDLPKGPELAQKQKGFFTAISYSLFSPSFDSADLRTQNQESLGLAASFGYSYCPEKGVGVETSLGVLQNSKTDRSLPDFTLIKPAVGVLYSYSAEIFFMAGVFNYVQHGETFKNFRSYFGQEYFFGYKANRTINLKFGFSYSKFSGDFASGSDTINSLVSIRGFESKFVYNF